MENIRYDVVKNCDTCRWIRVFLNDEDYQRWTTEDEYSCEDSLCCALKDGIKIEDKYSIPDWCPLIKPKCDKCGVERNG